MGLAMGNTAIAVIYSPWGKRSGAHINPSTTLTFFRLGKINKWDAMFYIASQFAGGLIGAFSAAVALSAWASHPAVNYVVTMSRNDGALAALIAEITIAFILMPLC
jgi:aquaporin Z